MAKLLFLQLNEYELHGLEAMAGELKKHAHAVKLLVRYFEKTPFREIEKFAPDIIGFPVVSSERAEALAWATAIKSRINPLILFGGIDPTFFPETVEHDAVDIVCRGESERALVRLLDTIDRKEDFTGIENCWVKKDGKIYKNPMGPLIHDLKEIAPPDKEIYYSRYAYFRNYPIKFFMASRGCPFSCSYCANQGLRDLYPNRASYLRAKSPSALLGEIKTVLARKYPVRTLGFNDDHFSHDLQWLEQFLPAYKKEVGLPFFCAGRIDQLTEEKARVLKEGGCYSFWYGLETAIPEHRAQILDRKMSNEAIEAGMEILHRHGIITQSYNILNYPGETFENALATLDYNTKLRNDFVVSSLFQPFPGTELAREAGMDEKAGGSQPVADKFNYFAYSPFKQKDSEKIEKTHKLFIAGFRSGLIRKLLPFLVKLPQNPLFDIIFLITFGLDYSRVHRLTFWETFKYNIGHIRTTYLQRKARVPKE